MAASVASAIRRRWEAGALGIGLAAVGGSVRAQGCMPLRFTSPSLGGQATTFLRPHEWQAGLALRRVATNRFFVGTAENETAAPGGQPLRLRLNSADLSVSYGVSERTSLSVTVPLFYGTGSNLHPDGLRHQVSTAGIGDINALGTLWLASPSQHPTGNVQVGLGIKTPSGSHTLARDFFAPDGSVSQQPVTQTLQLGDGGWAIPVQLQAFQQIFPRGSVYASGVYSISLRKHTEVLWPPANALWAVPDVYSARVGLAYAVAPNSGFSLSLGGRIDGTTSRDLIGGRDDFMRHNGYTMYVDPGLSLVTGRNQLTLSVPVRVRENYLPMTLSDGTIRTGAGGVNDFVVYAGYTRRL
jgi:hypothetical protein